MQVRQAVTLCPGTIRLRDVELPQPVAGQLLVEVRAAGICGSDVAIHRGPFPGRLTLPRVLGHEWSGRVVQVGPGVERFRPGDPVVSEEIFWCGECTRCRIGAYDLCENPPSSASRWMVPMRRTSSSPSATPISFPAASISR